MREFLSSEGHFALNFCHSFSLLQFQIKTNRETQLGIAIALFGCVADRRLEAEAVRDDPGSSSTLPPATGVLLD
jgi:hypothetical protein